jgi:spermidine synthase
VGQTASRFLMHHAEQLDVVDIEPRVFPFIAEHFGADWLDDPRVRALGDDGRTVVVHGQGGYDLVSIEVGQTFRPGAATFYTREFYAAVRERLTDGGIVSQFVPLPFLDDATLRSLVATFVDVFPHSLLWYNTAELLLIGGDGWRLDPARLTRVEADLRDELAYSQWGGAHWYLHDLGAFLGGFLAGPEALADLAAGAPLLRDDRPRLDYATRKARQETDRSPQLAPLIAAAAHAPDALLAGPVAPGVLARAARVQQLNLADLTAATHVARASRRRAVGDLRSAARELDQALAINPENVNATRIMGDVMAEANRNEEAARWFRRALAQRPDDLVVARLLGATLVKLGRPAEAVPVLEPVVAARPSDVDAWNALGAALAGVGRLEEAVACFERARDLDPQDMAALQNLQRARNQLRQSRARSGG